MTYNNHPITPPPELIRKWNEDAATAPMADQRYIATQAARWGADQELEACIKLLSDLGGDGEMIRRYRRSKPPSLKAQALEALKHAEEGWRPVPADCEIIRRALERLQELEVQVEAQVND